MPDITIRFPDGSTKTYPEAMPREDIKADVERERAQRSRAPNEAELRAARSMGRLNRDNTPVDVSADEVLPDLLRGMGMAAGFIPGLGPLATAGRVAGSVLPSVLAEMVEKEGDPLSTLGTESLLNAAGEGMSRVPAGPILRLGGKLSNAFSGALKQGPHAFDNQIAAFIRQMDRGNTIVPNRPAQVDQEKVVSPLYQRLMDYMRTNMDPQAVPPQVGSRVRVPAGGAGAAASAPTPTGGGVRVTRVPSQQGQIPARGMPIPAGPRELPPASDVPPDLWTVPGTAQSPEVLGSFDNAVKEGREVVPVSAQPEGMTAPPRLNTHRVNVGGGGGAAPPSQAQLPGNIGRRLDLPNLAVEGVDDVRKQIQARSSMAVDDEEAAVEQGARLIGNLLSRGQNAAGNITLAEQMKLRDFFTKHLRHQMMNTSGPTPAISPGIEQLSKALGFDPYNALPSEAHAVISELGTSGAVRSRIKDAMKGIKHQADDTDALSSAVHQRWREALGKMDPNAGRTDMDTFQSLSDDYRDHKLIQQFNANVRQDAAGPAIRAAQGATIGTSLGWLLGQPGTGAGLGGGLGMLLGEPGRMFNVMVRAPRSAARPLVGGARFLLQEGEDDGE